MAGATILPVSTRRARLAVSLMFGTNGALFANLVPRFPGIKADLELSNSAYGLVIAVFPAGAILAGLAAAKVIRRLGSARAATLCTVLAATGIAGAGFAYSVFPLLLTLFAAGAADSIVDVAQNAHGLRVQRHYGRSIINSFHAIWSVGAVLGGVMSAGAITLGLSRATHLSLSALVFSAVAAWAYTMRLPGSDSADPLQPASAAPKESTGYTGPSKRTVLMLTGLVFIAIAGVSVEDAAASWAALYMTVDLGAPAAVGAFGFVALVAAQFVGRIFGDRQVDALGQREVARLGAAITAAGMGVALAFPSLPSVLLGFAAAGYGIATIVPAAMQRADDIPGLKAGTGVMVVSWLMRLGFLCSPPLIGLVADNHGLRIGLLVIPLAGLTVVALSGLLKTGPQSSAPPAQQ